MTELMDKRLMQWTWMKKSLEWKRAKSLKRYFTIYENILTYLEKIALDDKGDALTAAALFCETIKQKSDANAALSELVVSFSELLCVTPRYYTLTSYSLL